MKIFAPGLWYGYDGVIFPGVIEALEKGDEAEAKHWVQKIASAINEVAAMLEESS